MFEAFSKSGSSQNAIMKAKRKAHGRYVKKHEVVFDEPETSSSTKMPDENIDNEELKVGVNFKKIGW